MTVPHDMSRVLFTCQVCAAFGGSPQCAILLNMTPSIHSGSLVLLTVSSLDLYRKAGVPGIVFVSPTESQLALSISETLELHQS